MSRRLAFENRNKSDPYTQKKAWSEVEHTIIAFEVASEGELEQVLPLIEACWQRQYKVELIFASPSVEHKVLALAQAHAHQLRILRLPLLTGRSLAGGPLREWMSAQCLILCRYDFYPSLIWAGLRPGRRLALVSATLKNKKFKSPLGFIYRWLYQQLAAVICATQTDAYNMIREMGLSEQSVLAMDFRPLRIVRRLKQSNSVLSQRPGLATFLTYFQRWAYERRIILGSAWPTDLGLFQHAEFCREISQGLWGVLILAHDLGTANLAQLQQEFNHITAAHKVPWYTWRLDMSEEQQRDQIAAMQARPGVICLEAKGILVELYCQGLYAHVGGGHGRSVHSVLEPYLAGCLVSCGPRVQRSTEVDLIQEQAPERLRILPTLANWADPVLSAGPLPSSDFLPSDEKFSLMERALEQNSQASMNFLFERVLGPRP